MEPLEQLVAATLAQSVPDEIRAVAREVEAHHRDVAAILAYGSCLRGVAATDSLIDLYVLTRNLAGVSRNAASRLACALAPPNVYYADCQVAGRHYRAKHAVLPLAVFARWMTADNPYFWARFAQPAALVHSASDADREAIVRAVVQACRTMFGNARGLCRGGDAMAAWTAGFAATYGTELRSERNAARAAAIVKANAGHYLRAAALMADIAPLEANWRLRRLRGKLWSLVRLIKASFTFAGGADYLAWKIERHSGEKIEVTDWQRRHPVIAGLLLLPRLLRRGAVR